MDFSVKKIQKTGISEKTGHMPHACVKWYYKLFITLLYFFGLLILNQVFVGPFPIFGKNLPQLYLTIIREWR